MSYSRWSNSRWYTYWRTWGFSCKENQVFEVAGEQMFTYTQLKLEMKKCLDDIERSNFYRGDPVTKEERRELRRYMRQFIKDVEKEFKWQVLY